MSRQRQRLLRLTNYGVSQSAIPDWLEKNSLMHTICKTCASPLFCRSCQKTKKKPEKKKNILSDVDEAGKMPANLRPTVIIASKLLSETLLVTMNCADCQFAW